MSFSVFFFTNLKRSRIKQEKERSAGRRLVSKIIHSVEAWYSLVVIRISYIIWDYFSRAVSVNSDQTTLLQKGERFFPPPKPPKMADVTVDRLLWDLQNQNSFKIDLQWIFSSGCLVDY